MADLKTLLMALQNMNPTSLQDMLGNTTTSRMPRAAEQRPEELEYRMALPAKVEPTAQNQAPSLTALPQPTAPIPAGEAPEETQRRTNLENIEMAKEAQSDRLDVNYGVLGTSLGGNLLKQGLGTGITAALGGNITPNLGGTLAGLGGTLVGAIPSIAGYGNPALNWMAGQLGSTAGMLGANALGVGGKLFSDAAQAAGSTLGSIGGIPGLNPIGGIGGGNFSNPYSSYLETAVNSFFPVLGTVLGGFLEGAMGGDKTPKIDPRAYQLSVDATKRVENMRAQGMTDRDIADWALKNNYVATGNPSGLGSTKTPWSQQVGALYHPGEYLAYQEAVTGTLTEGSGSTGLPLSYGYSSNPKTPYGKQVWTYNPDSTNPTAETMEFSTPQELLNAPVKWTDVMGMGMGGGLDPESLYGGKNFDFENWWLGSSGIDPETWNLNKGAWSYLAHGDPAKANQMMMDYILGQTGQVPGSADWATPSVYTPHTSQTTTNPNYAANKAVMDAREEEQKTQARQLLSKLLGGGY